MTHKIVAFVPSDKTELQSYLTSQLSMLANNILNLETELADENDARHKRHSRTPDRFPCLMLFKDGVYKNHINSKMTDEYALQWSIGAIG
jgi:hypothetical protein